MTRVLVVGDVVDDLVVRPLGTITEASDTAAQIRRSHGGSAANVAAWLGHLGADVRFAGRAGLDGAKRHAAALAAYGVDARIAADPDLPTATIVVTLDGEGERTMYVDRAANTTLAASDLSDDLLDGVGWLHLTGYSLFDDAVRPAVLDLAERARERGCGISVDPSSVGFLTGCGVAPFLDWVAGADVLLPNLPEAQFLTGESDPERAAASLAARFPTVVVTQGTDGAVLADADGLRRATASPTDVVDTTGAGDAFCAGFLSIWVDNPDGEAALAAGTATASRLVAKLGARP